MSQQRKYTPPSGRDDHATDEDIMAAFFEGVMQSASDALKRLSGHRSQRLGSPALAMAVEAGLAPQMAYTVADTARYTGIDRQTFYREHDAGRIEWIVPNGQEKGARISVYEVDRWMEENVE